jgi:hypothetical protein
MFPDGSCYWQFYVYRPVKVINYAALRKYYSGIRCMLLIFLPLMVTECSANRLCGRFTATRARQIGIARAERPALPQADRPLLRREARSETRVA